MPTYSYKCNQCGHEFDARQRMSDDPLTECPVCGGPVRRVVSSVGIVFKGKGFYVTDNRSSANGRVQTAEKSSDAGDKSDTSDKPADKPKKSDKGSESAKSKSTEAAASSAA